MQFRTHPKSRRTARLSWSAVDPMVVLSAVGLCLSVAVIAALGAAVGANDPIPLDRAVDQAVPHPMARGLFLPLLRDLGGEKGAFLLAVAGGLLMWIVRRDWTTGLALIAAYTGASATAFILKAAIGRRGPNAFDPSSPGFSFPSAHSARVVTVVSVLVVLSALLGLRKLALAAGVGGAIAIAGMMVAQLVERHHWLTDQIGGVAVGTGWTFIMVPVAVTLRRRRSSI